MLRRFQKSVSDPSTALAMLFVVAGAQGLTTVALPHWQLERTGLVVAVSATALGTGLVLALTHKYLRTWMLHAFLSAGVVGASIAVYGCGNLPSSMSASLFYFWAVLYAGAFFSPRAVTAYVAAVGAEYAVAMLADPGRSAPAQWLQTMTVIMGCAWIVTGFASGMRRSRSRAHLEASRFRHLANAVPVGIVEADRDMRLIFANESIDRMLGASLVGLTSNDAITRYIDPRDQPAMREAAVTTRSGQKARLQVRVVGVDGLLHWVAWSSAPEAGPAGSFIGAFVSLLDITPLKQSETELAERAKELAAANEEVRRSNEDLEQFAYVASHDLREPLRAMELPLTLISERYGDKLGPDAQDWIGIAVDGCQRMQQMIDSLLAYSRIGRLEAEVVRVDSNTVMADVVTDLSSAITTANACVRVGALPVIETEPTQLRAVLQNLVSNALKFAEPGRPPVVDVAAERRGSMWRFTVTDNGIGIPPAQRERIFGMFKRLHSRDKYPGSGIGLSIVKKTVERRGGQIGVEDAPSGQGARFWFTLPALPDEPANHDVPEARLANSAAAAG